MCHDTGVKRGTWRGRAPAFGTSAPACDHSLMGLHAPRHGTPFLLQTDTPQWRTSVQMLQERGRDLGSKRQSRGELAPRVLVGEHKMPGFPPGDNDDVWVWQRWLSSPWCPPDGGDSWAFELKFTSSSGALKNTFTGTEDTRTSCPP